MITRRKQSASSNCRGWILERGLSLNWIPRYHSLYSFNIFVLIYLLEFLAHSLFGTGTMGDA